MKIELHIDKWVQNGYTLAHASPGLEPSIEGKPFFVHGALPGEIVLAEVVKEKANHAFAITRKVIKSSPERIESDCPIFPACGGCSFRHIHYETEQQLKKDLLSEWKYLSGKDEQIPFFTASRNHYRNHIQLQYTQKQSGFFQLHSNKLIPLPDQGCLNLVEELNHQIRNVKNSAASENGGTETGTNSKIRLRTGKPEGNTLKADFPGTPFNSWLFPADGFFQNNSLLIQTWLDTIRSFIPENLITEEWFSGSGLIGGYLRPLLKSYRGYESDRRAIQCARLNFEKRKLPGKFSEFDLYRKIPEIRSQLLIVNPPRAGLNQNLIRAILNSTVHFIVYSSCNPHSLNRDVERLSGQFKVKRKAVFDFFPGTPHLEMVLRLER